MASGEQHSWTQLDARAVHSAMSCAAHAAAERTSAVALTSTSNLSKLQAMQVLRRGVGGQEKILEVRHQPACAPPPVLPSKPAMQNPLPFSQPTDVLPPTTRPIAVGI